MSRRPVAQSPRKNDSNQGGKELITAPRKKSRSTNRKKSQGGLSRLSNTPSVVGVGEVEATDVIDEVPDTPPPEIPPGEVVDEVSNIEEVTAVAQPTEEQRKQLRICRLEAAFDEMDSNGDGRLDISELRQGLFNMGVLDASAADIRKVFDSETVTLEQFLSDNTLQRLFNIRTTKAAEDYLLHAKKTNTILPDRLLQHVTLYMNISSLRASAGCCKAVRRICVNDDIWKPLLLKRRRDEMARASVKCSSLPEVKCQDNFYEWYLQWLKEVHSDQDQQKWSARISEEIVGGDVQVTFTDKVSTCIAVITPYCELTDELLNMSADSDAPPPPPPELDLVAIGDEAGNVVIHSLVSTTKPLHTLSEHDGAITCIEQSKAFVAVASADCTISIWNKSSLSVPVFNLIGHSDSVSTVSFCEWDEEQAVSGSLDRKVIIWSKLEEQKIPARRVSNCNKFASQIVPKHVCEGHTMKVTAMILTQECLYTAGRDSLILKWDWDGNQTSKMEGHTGPVNCLQSVTITKAESELPLLVSACGGGVLKLWEKATGRLHHNKRIHDSPIECMAVSDTLRIVVTAAWDHSVVLYSLLTNTMVYTFDGHAGVVRSLWIDVPSCRLLTAGDAKSISVFDLTTLTFHPETSRDQKYVVKPYYTLLGPKASIISLALTKEHEGKWYNLYGVTKDKSLYLWHYSPNSPLQQRLATKNELTS